MSEYTDLIQKEKEEALRDYREEAFRARLDQKIAETYRPSRSYVSWFQKPAVAGSTVLLVLFLGWLSSQFFLSSTRGSEEMRIKNTIVRMLSQHGSILSQSSIPGDIGSEKSPIREFEWSIKRVIFAIKRERSPDDDLAQNLRQVLQNADTIMKTGKNNNQKSKN